MSERKVLNKYYPPDFDPSKIPKLRQEGGKNGTFSIRIMAPFNMRCNVCGEYIYKGKKFNSRKENVEDEYYLGLRIFRFYIRCPKCVAEIAFKTDLKNTDYTLEAGATRLFEAEKLARQMAEQEQAAKEADELNPMKVLENRTKASHREMAQIDELEELREINARHAKVDTGAYLEKQRLYEEHLLKLQLEEEDRMVKSIFGEGSGQGVKRLADSDSDEEGEGAKAKVKKPALGSDMKPTELLTDGPEKKKTEPKKTESWQRSVGTLSSKGGLAGLVKKKPATKPALAVTKPSSSTASNPALKQGGVLAKSPTTIPATESSVYKAATDTQKAVAAGLASQAKAQSATAASTSLKNGLVASAKTVSNTPSTNNSSANGSLTLGGGSALGLLGDYSDSESGSGSD